MNKQVLGVIVSCLVLVSLHAQAPSDRQDGVLFSAFENPPTGYGQVPFYWWVGEKLTRERLLWQLEELHNAGVQGFSVSYPHGHPQSDPELHSDGYGTFGMTYPSDPPFLSEEWWEIWNWFTGECARRGMGVGLDDYTFAVPGNRHWPDDIAAMPEMKKYHGKLEFSEPEPIKGGRTAFFKIDTNTVTLTAYPQVANRLDGTSAVDLLNYSVNDTLVRWSVPATSDWMVFAVSTDHSFMLHPRHGAEVIDRYFQIFEDKVDPGNREGINYFFQDELTIDLGVGTWSEDFSTEFRARKGYDICPHLAALQTDIGDQTEKIRLDYMDVLLDLAEERYFKPIFEWHDRRGLIFGCDNYGRGLNPLAYGDYFRTTRWFTAPGNDAPQGGTALVQTKVSSSIAHLYHRPRVWLEAFHSMGWDARPEQITRATDIHYLLGGNLLCLHGLYYSTLGGWWEWAPPDFHFRMPYWPHMKGWLKYVERLSYILSQGRHVCDVAVVYPTSSMQAFTDAGPKGAFAVAHSLFDAGIDFDFIDYQSLARAEVKDGKLAVAGEEYRVLIIADMKAMRFTSLEKARDLFRSGGLVLATGALPQASDRKGRTDAEVDKIVREMFGLSAAEAMSGRKAELQHSSSGGLGTALPSGNEKEICDIIRKTFTPDFLPEKGKGHVLHRRVDDKDIYMVMDVPKGTPCFFRAHGAVELWDAHSGERKSLPVMKTTGEGTTLRIPLDIPQPSLIVFSPGKAIRENKPAPESEKNFLPVMELKGEWECEIKPVLDNRWGDYRFPASDDIIGPEARELMYTMESPATEKWKDPEFDDSAWQPVFCGFGPQMWKMSIPDDRNVDAILVELINGNQTFTRQNASAEDMQWKPYSFSWKYGVNGEPGSQGYHGLKGKISDHFMIMGEGGHFVFGSYVDVPGKMTVRLEKEGIVPYGIWIDKQKVESDSVVLEEGLHRIIVCYKDIPAAPKPEGHVFIDERARAAIVLMENKAFIGKSQPLSMKWYDRDGVLPYDYIGGDKQHGYYRFTAPPGLQALNFSGYGDFQVWVDGKEMSIHKKDVGSDGLCNYEVVLEKPVRMFSTVALRVEHKPGYYGGSAFSKPVAMTCTKGEIPAGDWSEMGVLEHYSGGMWYRRSFQLTEGQVGSGFFLDLGRVVATCEVHVNGEKAGVLISKPFRLDISDYIKTGENRLEILVYNTLSNHYQTIPTPVHYKKTTASGLIGPVKLVKR